MTEEEINKTIAEFMGDKWFSREEWDSKELTERAGIYLSPAYEVYIGNHYTQSLDALVPVVEKLGADYVDFEMGHDEKLVTMIEHQDVQGDWHKWHMVAKGRTLSMALATACAEVIKELS